MPKRKKQKPIDPAAHLHEIAAAYLIIKSKSRYTPAERLRAIKRLNRLTGLERPEGAADSEGEPDEAPPRPNPDA